MTRHTISMAVSSRLKGKLGRPLGPETLSSILLMFDVTVEITDDGRLHLHHDKNLEKAVKYLCAGFSDAKFPST